MENQTRLESLTEAIINTLIGFAINFFANLILLPQMGCQNTTATLAFSVGLIFTAISVARSYVIRRWAQQHLRSLSKKVATYIYNLKRSIA